MSSTQENFHPEWEEHTNAGGTFEEYLMQVPAGELSQIRADEQDTADKWLANSIRQAKEYQARRTA